MKKLTALALIAAMLLSLCACGDNTEPSKSKKSNRDSENSYTEETYTQPPEPEKYFDSTRLKKIGKSNYAAYLYSDVDSKTYGVVSADGSYETGTIYYNVETHTTGDFVAARAKQYGAADDLDSINSVELLDCDAKTLIGGYCHYETLTDRFYIAAKVVGICTEGSADFEYETSDGLVSYDAEFYVYDVQEDKIVDGVKAYDLNKIHASGTFIQIEDEAGNKEVINVKGYNVPDNAEFVTHMSGYHDINANVGYYEVKSGSTTAVYDSDNKLVYSYNWSDGGYSIIGYYSGYFRAVSSDYEVILDENFKHIMPAIHSSGNSGIFQMCNNLFLFKQVNSEEDVKYRIYDFNGNIVYESDYALTVHAPTDRLGYMMYYTFTSTNDDIIIITRDGEIVYEGKGDFSVNNDDFSDSAYKKVGEDYYYFCLADKDFTVKADEYTHLGPYFVQTEQEDGTHVLIDLITGKTVLSGYEKYYARTVGNETYIRGMFKDGTADIYYAAYPQ